MKATKSNDGLFRFTLSIKIRIGREDIIYCIGWHLMTYGSDLPKSRRETIALVRDVKIKEGIIEWGWQEEVTPDMWKAVAACVDGLFPELCIGRSKQIKIMKYYCQGHHEVSAESVKDAAYIIADRKTRKSFGRSGKWSALRHEGVINGKSAEFQVFIGRASGKELVGHNVRFQVTLLD